MRREIREQQTTPKDILFVCLRGASQWQTATISWPNHAKDDDNKERSLPHCQLAGRPRDCSKSSHRIQHSTRSSVQSNQVQVSTNDKANFGAQFELTRHYFHSLGGHMRRVVLVHVWVFFRFRECRGQAHYVRHTQPVLCSRRTCCTTW